MARPAKRAQEPQATRGMDLATRLALAAILVGILLRLLTILRMDVWEDGAEYVAMGHTWSLRHDFLLPYGEERTRVPLPVPGFSHHYPPAFPLYLGLVYSALGFGIAQTKLALVGISLLVMAVTFFATKDLYGTRPALLLTGLVALEPDLLWVTGTGYSESFSMIFFVLTMWAIIRSLKDERFIVLAGLFAGIAYLSRSSMGYFFLVAGGGGFLWRFYYRRWKVLTSPWYLLAIAVFAAFVAVWSWRNVSLFGWPNWQTSLYLSTANQYALSHPGQVFNALVGKSFFFAFLFAAYAVFFLPEIGASLRRVREEETSALWVSVFLVWVLAWVVTAFLWPYEPRDMWDWEHHRYVVIGLVPLGWAVLREWKPGGSLVARWSVLAVAMLLVSTIILTAPVKSPEPRAAEFLDPLLKPGDVVLSFGAGFGQYNVYPYLSHPESILVSREPAKHPNATFYLVDGDARPPPGNYTLLGTFTQHYLWKPAAATRVWALTNVTAERGLPTGVDRSFR